MFQNDACKTIYNCTPNIFHSNFVHFCLKSRNKTLACSNHTLEIMT